VLALNCSLLNREHVLINVLNAFASIVPMRILHVIFLSNITQRYFTLFTNGKLHPFNVRIVRSRTKATELVSFWTQVVICHVDYSYTRINI
jgi:hypothetical protein